MNADPYNLPLTQAQRARLERAKDDGELGGVTSTYHLLRNEMGPAGPNKNQISTFMRALPSVQINRTTKSVASTKNVIGPMIPPAIALSWCAADTAFIPACYHTDKKVYKAIIVFVCGLTKYLYVHPCSFGNQDRPMSTTARDGFIEFVRRARIAGALALHPQKLRTDRGSEFAAGAFKTWMTTQRTQHPDHYEQTFTTGSRAAGNAFAEVVIKTYRRLLYAYYRVIEKQWEINNTPARQRVFNWVPVLGIVTQRYNERRHGTIKATPIDAIRGINPTYQETQRQIIESAKKRYGNHVTDRMQPGFSSAENRDLDVGDLVRTLNIKSGPGRAVWDAKKSKKMSAGGNWSEELFVVARVRRANSDFGNSSYIIAELDQTQPGNIGDEKTGVYTRQQLLFCPPETLDYISSDDSSSSDDDDEDQQPINANAVDARPLKPGDWRFKKGDVLLFQKDFFIAAPGGLNGLEAVRMRRDRTGIITERVRERPNARRNKGQFLYQVLFSDPARYVPTRTSDRQGNTYGLPLDRDPDVLFLNETVR